MADWSTLCSVVLKFSAKVIDVSRPEYVGLDLNDRQIWLKNIEVRYLLNANVKIVLLSLRRIHVRMLAVNKAFSYEVHSLCRDQNKACNHVKF